MKQTIEHYGAAINDFDLCLIDEFLTTICDKF